MAHNKFSSGNKTHNNNAQCDDCGESDEPNALRQYLSYGRGEPTEIAGSICSFIRRQYFEKVLRPRHISLSKQGYSEDERCLSFINGEATWPWDSADLLTDTLIGETEVTSCARLIVVQVVGTGSTD